jgi:hypothetical protein
MPITSAQIRAGEQLDSWKVRGLARPGAWFAKNTTEKPVTIGLSKSGQGVGGAEEHKVSRWKEEHVAG